MRRRTAGRTRPYPRPGRARGRSSSTTKPTSASWWPRFLHLAGIDCATAGNGSQARAAIEAADEAFDIVISDLRMPEMDEAHSSTGSAATARRWRTARCS